ncbi:MAG: radical SAM protein [Fidelibacterota bacterium]
MSNIQDVTTWPAFLRVHESGLLKEKVRKARDMLAQCQVCPRECGIDRLEDKRAVCKSGRKAIVHSYFPHFGEEDCLRGWNGSGTIFFDHCNLRCVFCQNHEISQPVSMKAGGREVDADDLANMMIALQDRGCHNINLVTPEHVVPQIVEALPIAIEKGLHIPLVYNTSAFDSPESIALMGGLVDIYMPDFKFWDKELSRRYLREEKYPETAKSSIREMHRQVGDLLIDDYGLAVRGVLVRYLVMPGMGTDARNIFSFLAEEISPDTYINIMAQYHPAFKVSDRRFSELNRTVTQAEMEELYIYARKKGLHRFDRRFSGFV